MTPHAATPRPLRWRRRLLLGSIVVSLAAVAALVVAPRILRAIGGRLLAGEWGGPAEVDSAWWSLDGRELRLRGARAYVPGQSRPLAEVGRVVLVFERSFWSGDPGKLLHGIFEMGVIRHDGELVTHVQRVEYAARGTKLLEVRGVDGDLERGRESDWVEPIARITDAPGVRSDGKGTPLELIEVHETKVRVLFPRADDGPISVPLFGIEARLCMQGPKTMAIEDLQAEVCGGHARGFGRVDWSGEASWHVQMNLTDLDLTSMAKDSGVLAKTSGGSLSAFLDLGQGGAATLAGAGWIEGHDVVLWDQPIMGGLLRTLGLTAGPDDAIREVRGRFRVDRGHFLADELIARGKPLNLFGTGSVQLDGEALDVRFVPRLFSKDLGRIAVVGQPTQVLLDLVNGLLVEVRMTGSLSSIDTKVNPVSAITAPLRAFLDRFSNDHK